MIAPSAPLALTMHLAWVSSISFGGFPTVLPDLRDFVVGTHRWMTNQEFANLFAMAQAKHDSDDEFRRLESVGISRGPCERVRHLRAALCDVLHCVPSMGQVPRRTMATGIP